MRLSVIAMFAIAPMITAGCGERDLDKVSTSEERALEADEIAKNPQAYYNRPVTVVADIEKVISPTAFTLDEDAGLAGPDVLVITQKPVQALEGDQEVMVHGIVRPMVVAELQRDYPWFNPDPNLEADYRQRPVIIADMVRDESRGDLIANAPKRPAPVAPAGETGAAPDDEQKPPAANAPRPPAE